MGLEIVEVVLEVEDEFKIKISHLDLSCIVTVGGLYQMIVKARKKDGQLPKDFADEIYTETWQKLQHIISKQIRQDIDIITKDVHLIRDLDMG